VGRFLRRSVYIYVINLPSALMLGGADGGGEASHVTFAVGGRFEAAAYVPSQLEPVQGMCVPKQKTLSVGREGEPSAIVISYVCVSVIKTCTKICELTVKLSIICQLR